MTKTSIQVVIQCGCMMVIALLLMCCFVIATHAAELNVPETVAAGSSLSIPTSGRCRIKSIAIAPKYEAIVLNSNMEKYKLLSVMLTTCNP